MSEPSSGTETRARVDDSDLWWEVADPTDESIAALDLGEGPGAHHVRDFFRNRAWTGLGDMDPSTCIKLTDTSGQLVGYCAFVTSHSRHPTSDSKTKARTLTLLQFGIVPAFRKLDNSVEPRRPYACLALELIQSIAVDEGAAAITLAAEIENVDAIEFYERNRYGRDGVYQSKRYQTDMQRMRKNLDR